MPRLFANLHRNHWHTPKPPEGQRALEAYANCTHHGLSVRVAADRVVTTVDKSFRWRHPFLREVVPHQHKGVVGLLEVFETYFRESKNGSCKVIRPARYSGGRAKGAGRKTKDWCPSRSGAFAAPLHAENCTKRIWP